MEDLFNLSLTNNINPTATKYLQSYETTLKNNPNDFYIWEKYITLLESLNANITTDNQNHTTNNENPITTKLLSAYNIFLQKFPLLYGYWKKYAELTHLITKDFKKVISIYERAIDIKTGIQNNPDLWSNYCIYVAEQSSDLNEIRTLFERAITIIGNDYYSRILWEKYIEFEISQEEYENVIKLYKRAIQIPSRDLTLIWSQFKEFFKNLKQSSKIDLLKREFILSLQQNNLNLENNNEKINLNELFNEWRDLYYRPSKKELERIRNYEDGIRRPYFHVQPFQEHELNHFRKYLEDEENYLFNNNQSNTFTNELNNELNNNMMKDDMNEEEKKDNNNEEEEKKRKMDRMISLFERMIVYGAFYIEFWNRYFQFLEKHKSDKIISLYERLTKYSVLKDKYYIHLKYAEYLELNTLQDNLENNMEQIEQVYNHLIYNQCIGHLESVMQTIYFYKRNLNYLKVNELFKNYLQNFKDEFSKIYFQLEHAKYLYQFENNFNESRNIYLNLLNNIKGMKCIYLEYINMECQYILMNRNDFNYFNNLIDFILNLEYYTTKNSNNNKEEEEKESMDHLVKKYLNMWGMPNKEDNNNSNNNEKKRVEYELSINLKIEILNYLKKQLGMYFNNLKKIQQVKETLEKLQLEQSETIRKRRLQSTDQSSSKKVMSETNNIPQWTFEQYQQYYQQYYQYYQQFTNIL
ncbi:hypothetical protein ABK040_005593 [Willaertia magna]